MSNKKTIPPFSIVHSVTGYVQHLWGVDNLLEAFDVIQANAHYEGYHWLIDNQQGMQIGEVWVNGITIRRPA